MANQFWGMEYGSYLPQHRRVDHFVPSVHRKANCTFVATMSYLHRLEDLRGPCDFCARCGERGAPDASMRT